MAQPLIENLKVNCQMSLFSYKKLEYFVLEINMDLVSILIKGSKGQMSSLSTKGQMSSAIQLIVKCHLCHTTKGQMSSLSYN